jgi:hypothetical protein
VACQAEYLAKQQMKEHFDAVMTTIPPKVVQMLHRDDILGRSRSLDQRWEFVDRK